jgi:hypothetical protein
VIGDSRPTILFSACDWLAALTARIPNAGEHLVRYYGCYSDVNRGKRRNARTKEEDASTLEDFREVSNAAAKRVWARRSAELVEASSSKCTKSIPWRAPSVRDPCGSSHSSSNPR